MKLKTIIYWLKVISSGDDNDQDEDLQKDKDKDTQMNSATTPAQLPAI